MCILIALMESQPLYPQQNEGTHIDKRDLTSYGYGQYGEGWRY